MLRGRDDVLALLERWLEGVGGGAGGALHLEGVPGVGKTAVLDWVANRGLDRHRRVLRVVGHPEESSIAWGGLSQLVSPHLSQLMSFEERPRNTLMRTMRLGDVGEVDDVSIGMSLLYLLTFSDEPTIVVVDDVQWLDMATISVLKFICRRLQSTGVGIVTAQHPGGALTDPSMITLAPLPTSHLRAIARDRGAVSAVADVLADHAQGLPMTLMHLIDALDVDQLEGRQPLPGDISELDLVDSVMSSRLAELPDTTRSLLAAAALAPYRSMSSLAAMLELPEAADVVAAAHTAQFAAIDGDRIVFRHPSIRTAAVHSLDPEERRDLHRLLARDADVQHAGWHRAAAATGPDDAVAEALDELAVDAEQRGASLEALRARQSAIDLAQTPRPERLIAAARHAVAARLPDVATSLIAQLDDSPAAASVRAEISWIRGDVGDARRRWTELATAEPASDLTTSSLRRAAMAAFRMYDLEGVLRLTRGDPLVRTEPVYPTSDPLLPVIDWGAASINGQPGATDRLIEEVHRVLPNARDPESVAVLAEVATLALARSGRSTELAEVSERIGDLANERAPRTVPALLIARAAYRARSDLAGAVALTREAIALAEEWDLHEHRPFALAIAAISEATIDGPDAAALSAAIRAYQLPVAVAVATYADALVCYVREDYSGAFELLRPLHDRHPADKSFGFYWHHDLVDIAVRVGETSYAMRVIDDLERIRAVSANPWVDAALLRCRGLVSSDRDEMERSLTGSIELFQASGYAVSAARVRLDLGERLRRLRQRSAARPHIDSAWTALMAAGATPWAARCEREAVALGLTPKETARSTPASAVLTPRELQVARWLVAGFTFKQIGARLFLSPRTAEAHGQTVYRKLGVRGRAELAQRAATDPSLSAIDL